MTATVRPGLERRLHAELAGEVRFDRFTRGRYATDASHYQIMPVGVVLPRSIAEAERAIALAREEGVTVLPRGGGTSQSGQTVNDSLVIDCQYRRSAPAGVFQGSGLLAVDPGDGPARKSVGSGKRVG